MQSCQWKAGILLRRTLYSQYNLFLQTRSSLCSRIPSEDGRYKIITIPNILCATRIAATPLIGTLVVQQQLTPAFSLFVVAGLTDLADGYIARKYHSQKSLLGSVLDPVADKFLVNTMFFTLTMVDLIPVALTTIVILRDVLLIAGGFYKRYRTMDPPYSIKRFFNPEVSSVQVVPTLASKVNTVLQLTVVGLAIASPVFDLSFQPFTALLHWITAATTIFSGVQYISGRAFRKV